MPPERFLRDYWQKRPLLIRGAFPNFAPPLAPDDLAGLACMDGALARIVLHDAKRDRWTLRDGPFDEAMFTQLPESHWTLLVQDADKWDAGTAALVEPFAFIPSWRIDDVMISYAVDGGGVGAHVDQYDVFLIQGLGRRRWAIDTRPDPPTGFRADVELKLLRRFSPTHEWILEPGDVLYLPPGVPHDGVAVGECMTFSVGMRAPSAAELVTDLVFSIAEHLPENERYADPDLYPATAYGEIDDAAVARAAAAMPWLRFAATDAARTRSGGRQATDTAIPYARLRTWFGCYMTRYRAVQAPAPRRRPVDRAALPKRLSQSVVERDPWSRFAWCRHGRAATLFVAGTAFDAPLAWARELAGPAREIPGSRLTGFPHQARGIALLADLLDAGHLRLHRRRTGN